MNGTPRVLLLATVVALLFAVRVVRFAPTHYSTDAIYLLAAAENARASRVDILAPDFTGRRHPLYRATLTAVVAAFGPSLLPLLALTYLGHLAAVLLLASLLDAAGASARAATLAAILLATFSGANNVFADPIHFSRPANLALALAALRALLVGRPWLYVGLYALTLGNYEDAALLPIAGIVIDALRVRPHPSGRAVAAHAAAFALLAAFTASSLSAADPGANGLGLGPHVIQNLARLPLEVGRTTLLLRSDLLPSVALRVLLAVVATGGALLTLRVRGLDVRPLLALLALTVVFAAPYALRPGDGAWQSRYLYFPAAGLLPAAAIVLATARRGPVVLLGVYVGIVGLLNTEAACAVIAERHLHRFRAEPRAVVHAVAAALAGEPPAHLDLSADDCAFLSRVQTPRPIPCLGPAGQP